GYVQHDEQRTQRQERECRELGLLVGGEADHAQRSPVLEKLLKANEERELPFAALLLLHALDLLLDLRQIREHELGRERLDVVDRRWRRTRHVGKTPHHLDERVRVAERRYHLLLEHGLLARVQRWREID